MIENILGWIGAAWVAIVGIFAMIYCIDYFRARNDEGKDW